jgi:hypothetical protein
LACCGMNVLCLSWPFYGPMPNVREPFCHRPKRRPTRNCAIGLYIRPLPVKRPCSAA